MSGLLALWDPAGADPRLVSALLPALADRGPAGTAVVPLGPAALGIACGDEDDEAATPGSFEGWTVGLDGVPRNLRPLRDELTARGRVPEGAPAAQLLATVFAEVGFVRGLERIDGEVAVVAWDAGAGRLWMARDRVGARSLCWAPVGAGAVVATDRAALLRHPDLHARVAPDEIARLVALGCLPPPASGLAGVRTLAPGEWVGVGAEGVTSGTSWTHAVNPEGSGGATARWARSLGFATALAVRQRTPLAGPVGVAFSGGAFSTGVARLAAERRGPSQVLLTLADDPGVEQARAGARALGLAIHEVAIPAEEVSGLVDAAAAAALVAPEALGWWALAARAWALDLPVLLTGVGGAESNRVEDRPLDRVRDRLPTRDDLQLASSLGGRLGGRLGDLAARLGAVRALAGPVSAPASGWARARFVDARDDEPVFAEVDALAARAPDGPPEARATWLERALLLPETTLRALDAAGATHQVSLRAPLASARLAELCATIPVGHLRRGGVPRALWLLSQSSAAPPPLPMTLPFGAWLRGPLAAELDRLSERLGAWVSPAHVDGLVRAARSGDPRGDRRLWALLVTSRWLATLAPRHGGLARG